MEQPYVIDMTDDDIYFCMFRMRIEVAEIMWFR